MSSTDRTPIAPIDPESHSCARRLDRRGFLRDTGLFVAAVLAAQGLAPNAALAESARYMEPVAKAGRERTYAIPATDSVSVDSADSVVLVRSKGKVYAFSLECPHKGRMLEWQAGGGQFFCPKHKARFSPDGANVGGRKTSALDRYAVRKVGGNITIALDRVLSANGTPAEWAAAAITV